MYEVTVAVCDTITLERRCYLQSYICLPARRHCSDDGDTLDDRGDPDPLWDRTLHRRSERKQPRPAHRGGHCDATCRRPSAPWGWRPLLGAAARRHHGRRHANGGCALRGPGFFAGPQREQSSYRQGGDDRRGWHRKEPRWGELFGVSSLGWIFVHGELWKAVLAFAPEETDRRDGEPMIGLGSKVTVVGFGEG